MQSTFLERQEGELWIPEPYQERGVGFVLQSGACGLFLDPGLGKTSIILAATKILKDRKIAGPVLVIAPLRVCYLVWPKERDKWSNFHDLSIEILHGSKKGAALRRNADIYVINPEGLPWLYNSVNRRFVKKMNMLVIDESTKFKRTTTKRFRLLRKELGQFKRRYILTGTPAPNGLIDLFGQIYILDAGLALGRYITHFREEYCFQDFDGYSYNLRKGAAEKIQEKIRPITMRMKAEDYVKMPELVNKTINVELPAKARRQYWELEKLFITQIADEEITAMNAGASSTKLRQLANGGIYGEDKDTFIRVHEEKVEALWDLVDSLQGQPLLVGYNFRHDVWHNKDKNKDLEYIGGGVSQKKADALIMSFNAGSLPVLFVHPQSVGHGINLQGVAQHVAIFGGMWDLELYDQLIRRVRRRGNPNEHVFVHHILALDTIDQVMMKALGAKDRTQQGLLNALKEHYAHRIAEINVRKEIA